MTYEWKCPKCGKLVETNRPMNESHVPPEKCECGNVDGFERKYNNAGFVLKGNGWFNKGGY